MGTTAEVHIGFGTVSTEKDGWLDTHIEQVSDLIEELGLTYQRVGHLEYSGVFIGLAAPHIEGDCWSEVRLDLPPMMGTAYWFDTQDVAERINTVIKAAHEYVPEALREIWPLEKELVLPRDVAWYAFPSYG